LISFLEIDELVGKCLKANWLFSSRKREIVWKNHLVALFMSVSSAGRGFHLKSWICAAERQSALFVDTAF